MATETVHKITLSTKKVVLMRDPKIKHQELAAKAVGNKFADAPSALNNAIQNELLKIMLVKVNEKEFLSHESLDDHLTYSEYNQCLKVLNKIMGGDVANEDPLIEVVSSGSK